MLCICIGTIYYKLDHSWEGSYSRAAMVFFVVGWVPWRKQALAKGYIMCIGGGAGGGFGSFDG